MAAAAVSAGPAVPVGSVEVVRWYQCRAGWRWTCEGPSQ